MPPAPTLEQLDGLTAESLDSSAPSAIDIVNTTPDTATPVHNTAASNEDVFDLPELVETFLVFVRALDHHSHVDGTFSKLYQWLRTRMDPEDVRRFAEQYSEVTRATRVQGTCDELFVALNAYLSTSRDLEVAIANHMEASTAATRTA